jgi:hypothetical protein
MIRIGLFSNFKGADTVLVDGSPSDIEALGRSLSEVASGKPFPLHEAAVVAPGHTVRLVAASDLPEAGALWWKCSNEGIETIKGKLDPLAMGSSGHQYFELEDTAVQLMVSVGEYGQEWWKKNG